MVPWISASSLPVHRIDHLGFIHGLCKGEPRPVDQLRTPGPTEDLDEAAGRGAAAGAGAACRTGAA